MSGRGRVAPRRSLLLAEGLLDRWAAASLVRPRVPQQRVGPQDRRAPRGRGRTQTDPAEKPSGKKFREETVARNRARSFSFENI